MVTVDTAVLSHPDAQMERRRIDDSFELLISTAASICESLHRQHCTVTLAIGEQRIVSGDLVSSRPMDGLAQATLRNEEPRSRRKIDAAGHLDRRDNNGWARSEFSKGLRLACGHRRSRLGWW